MADWLGLCRRAGCGGGGGTVLHRDCNDRRRLIGHIVGLDGARVRCWADLPCGQCSHQSSALGPVMPRQSQDPRVDPIIDMCPSVQGLQWNSGPN